MINKRLTTPRGFTVIELIIAIAIIVIVVLAIGMVLVDGQRGWSIQYDRIYSDVVTDGYVARRKFDTVMRMASRDKFSLGDAGSSVEVYYYANDDSAVVDRYAIRKHYQSRLSAGMYPAARSSRPAGPSK